MHEGVSDVIAERAQLAAGMNPVVTRMVVLSFAAHALLVASLLVAPDFWTGATAEKSTPMMISLGGAEGPDSGGMNTISNRAVQRVAEPDAKPERPTPPAAKAPEMVAPEPLAKPTPKTPTKLEKPRETSSSRKPTSGAAIAPGSGRVETPGAPQVPFGGLTTGGGGGTGGARVDVENFCCPAYLSAVVSQIKRNWNNRQGLTGQNTIKFVVRRDGTIEGIEVDQSGGQLLDIASMRALQVTRQVSGLPREFTSNQLTIYLIFEYSR